MSRSRDVSRSSSDLSSAAASSCTVLKRSRQCWPASNPFDGLCTWDTNRFLNDPPLYSMWPVCKGHQWPFTHGILNTLKKHNIDYNYLFCISFHATESWASRKKADVGTRCVKAIENINYFRQMIHRSQNWNLLTVLLTGLVTKYGGKFFLHRLFSHLYSG